MNELPPRPRRRQSGFTMIELITVMIIIGIMAVVALPRFDLLRGYDETGYRDKVRATLEYARKSAVAQRRNVLVSLAGNALTLTIASDIPEGAAATTFNRNLDLPTADRACGGAANQICAPGGVTLTGPATLRFSPLGSPSGTANCVLPQGVANFCYTVTGSTIMEVEAETGYVH